jgi:hypothetical protein
VQLVAVLDGLRKEFGVALDQWIDPAPDLHGVIPDVVIFVAGHGDDDLPAAAWC